MTAMGIALTLVFVATAAPTEFATFEKFSEGPVFDATGNLFVSWGPDGVAKISPSGQSSLWLKLPGANGHKILPDGTHLICAAGAIVRVAADGNIIEKAVTAWKGRPLGNPNDITLDGQGGYYFSDPEGSRKDPVGSIYHTNKMGETNLVAGGMWVPNGLVLSPDGQKLYVAETVPNRVVWFPVKPNGRLGAQELFANLPSGEKIEGPDGLTVDAKGNVYVAQLGAGAVLVLSPKGVLLHSMKTGLSDTSNLVFRDTKADELFVTGSIGHRTNTPGRVIRIRTQRGSAR